MSLETGEFGRSTCLSIGDPVCAVDVPGRVLCRARCCVGSGRYYILTLHVFMALVCVLSAIAVVCSTMTRCLCLGVSSRARSS